MATVIDGKKLAKKYEKVFKSAIQAEGIHPVLIIATCDPDDASQVYLRNKLKACERVGIECRIIEFGESHDTDSLISQIQLWNNDPEVSGIIVQLPLPKRFNVKAIQETISPEKDVDGFSPNSKFDCCTPRACLRMLEDYDIEVAGKHCVVIGRSEIVGKPLAKMLIDANATVTLCHSKTTAIQLENVCRMADIIFCAAGVANLVKPEYIKQGCVLVDVSINRDGEGNLCGDAEAGCEVYCDYYTPVPGGVGPMTVNTLLYHTLLAALGDSNV